MNDETMALMRRFGFFVTGASCFLYGALALLWQRPDPFAWYLPGLFGLVTAIILFFTSFVHRSKTKAAWDERYRFLSSRAASLAFWLMIILAPFLGVLRWQAWIDSETSLAVMGTFGAAGYLLVNVWFDWKDG